jgi:hypothetical protein
MAVALPGLWACSSSTGTPPPATTTATFTATFAQKVNNAIDLLFMVDDSVEATSMQKKLALQLPAFMQVLEALPDGPPDLHIAVVSSDMGAPGDVTANLGCTSTGSAGNFQYMPGAAATCSSTTINQGDTFISDVGGQTNFTDPIAAVLQCVAQLGDVGCGFNQPLASIDRALGADGVAPPLANANFLRRDAYLGIVILSHEDDCSAPPNTTIFSLNGGAQSITNPDGPVAHYRCNGGPRGAHTCKDPSGAMIVPPLNPPAGTTGTPPTLNLTDCQDNPSGASALTPVSQFVSDIKKLKQDPDNQIFVAAITAPADPYAVVWVPPVPPPGPQQASELWPQVMHSCGAEGGDNVNPMATMHPTDGSFGDPGVRITQFTQAFRNSVVASICDASYQQSMTAIATQLGSLIKPSCIHATFQQDSLGNPACAVTDHLTDPNGNTVDVPVPACAENGNVAPCWTLAQDTSACAPGDLVLKVQQDATGKSATAVATTLECPLCLPGSTLPGC